MFATLINSITIDQVFIVLFGLTATYLSFVRTEVWAKTIAPIVGLMGQPFWLYSTFVSQKPGMFLICCAYTIMYVLGCKNSWITIKTLYLKR